MVLVQARIVAITGELNLELQFVMSHGEVTDCAQGTDPWPSPRAVGTSARDFAISQCRAGLLAENLLFHLATPAGSALRACVMRFGGGPCQMPLVRTPDAPDKQGQWEARGRIAQSRPLRQAPPTSQPRPRDVLALAGATLPAPAMLPEAGRGDDGLLSGRACSPLDAAAECRRQRRCARTTRDGRSGVRATRRQIPRAEPSARGSEAPVSPVVSMRISWAWPMRSLQGSMTSMS